MPWGIFLKISLPYNVVCMLTTLPLVEVQDLLASSPQVVPLHGLRHLFGSAVPPCGMGGGHALEGTVDAGGWTGWWLRHWNSEPSRDLMILLPGSFYSRSGSWLVELSRWSFSSIAARGAIPTPQIPNSGQAKVAFHLRGLGW